VFQVGEGICGEDFRSRYGGMPLPSFAALVFRAENGPQRRGRMGRAERAPGRMYVEMLVCETRRQRGGGVLGGAALGGAVLRGVPGGAVPGTPILGGTVLGRAIP
jgi:hypothetical protein